MEETVSGAFGLTVRTYSEETRSQIREVRKRHPESAQIFDATLTLEKVKPGLLSAVMLEPNESAESFVNRYSVSRYMKLCTRWITLLLRHSLRESRRGYCGRLGLPSILEILLDSVCRLLGPAVSPDDTFHLTYLAKNGGVLGNAHRRVAKSNHIDLGAL